MNTRTGCSTAKTAVKTALYHHVAWSAYECMGCFEMIEIPALAVLTAGQMPVRIKSNPENLLIWRELMELDHQPCMEFKDAEMAKQAREFRKQRKKWTPDPLGKLRGATA